MRQQMIYFSMILDNCYEYFLSNKFILINKIELPFPYLIFPFRRILLAITTFSHIYLQYHDQHKAEDSKIMHRSNALPDWIVWVLTDPYSNFCERKN